MLPLCSEAEAFGFVDQEMTPTALAMTGIDPETGIKVRLELRIPFRPLDPEFSTVPVYYLKVCVSRLGKPFRWNKPPEGLVRGSLFIEFASEHMACERRGSGHDISLRAPVTRPFGAHQTPPDIMRRYRNVSKSSLATRPKTAPEPTSRWRWGRPALSCCSPGAPMRRPC